MSTGKFFHSPLKIHEIRGNKIINFFLKLLHPFLRIESYPFLEIFMKKIYYLIILVFLGSCDIDKDTQEPSNFDKIVLKNLNIQFELLSETAFNLVDSNIFTQPVLLKVGDPVFGIITKGSKTGQYVYKPNDKSILKDSAEYQICQGNDCKTGRILFNISPNSCIMDPHSDKFVANLRDTLFLPIISNDISYCPNAHISKIDDINVGHGFVHNDRAALILPAFFKGDLQFSYDMTNGYQTKKTPVELKVQLDQTYCDDHFKLNPDSFIFTGNPIQPLAIQKLLLNDFYSADFTDLSSFELINDSSTSINFSISVPGNEIQIQPLQTPASGSFSYRLCTNSGKCGIGRVSIKIQ